MRDDKRRGRALFVSFTQPKPGLQAISQATHLLDGHGPGGVHLELDEAAEVALGVGGVDHVHVHLVGLPRVGAGRLGDGVGWGGLGVLSPTYVAQKMGVT